MARLCFWLSLFLFLLIPVRTALAEPVVQPPISAYGERAAIRSVAMSPSGAKIAFIHSQKDRDLLFVYSKDEGVRPVVDLTSLQGNWVWFPTENHIVIRGYDNVRIPGYKGRLDFTAAFSYNLQTGKIRQLLDNNQQIYPAQSGLGAIIGQLQGASEVLMPAWTGRTDNDVGRAVFKVDLDRPKGRVFDVGNKYTIGWLIAPDGTVLAREDMHDTNNTYSIYTRIGGKSERLLRVEDTAKPPFSVLGVKPDRSALILSVRDDTMTDTFVELDFDGHIRPIQLGQNDAAVSGLFLDQNKTVHGLEYAGLLPSYEFYDPDVNAAVQDLLKQLEGVPVHIVDSSDDFSVLLLRIFDFASAGRYVVFDTSTDQLTGLTGARDAIPAEAIGEVMSIEYMARDDLTIPAILTWPAGVAPEARQNLPIIVMPHGGPRSHDSIGFDWIAQYFANRGYLVMQPNFRGSTGFGAAFMEAGNGEWGGKMQDDITDGLAALVAAGYADPERACIIGWSYGGYAALAGGAFTPDLYKCVVAIAPVSDLNRLFVEERRDHGRNHHILAYWREMIGDPRTDKDKLEARSPVNFAERFTAPVLLIHGEQDEVVDFGHSQRMRRALERADKRVELVKIKGDGHALVDSENRVEALTAMAAFVDREIGPDTVSTP